VEGQSGCATLRQAADKCSEINTISSLKKYVIHSFMSMNRHEEIKSRLNLGSACYTSGQNLLYASVLFKNILYYTTFYYNMILYIITLQTIILTIYI
jgi:hypothetical protein